MITWEKQNVVKSITINQTINILSRMYTLGTLVKATNILLLHIVAVETSCTNQIHVKQLKILVIIKCYTIHGSFISSFGTHVQYHIRRSSKFYNNVSL